jgi:hypothetical protein
VRRKCLELLLVRSFFLCAAELEGYLRKQEHMFFFVGITLLFSFVGISFLLVSQFLSVSQFCAYRSSVHFFFVGDAVLLGWTNFWCEGSVWSCSLSGTFFVCAAELEGYLRKQEHPFFFVGMAFLFSFVNMAVLFFFLSNSVFFCR